MGGEEGKRGGREKEGKGGMAEVVTCNTLHSE